MTTRKLNLTDKQRAEPVIVWLNISCFECYQQAGILLAGFYDYQKLDKFLERERFTDVRMSPPAMRYYLNQATA